MPTVTDQRRAAPAKPARSRPPFHADHVGSLLRPLALIEARQQAVRGHVAPGALRELEDAAIREAIAMQERVGLRSVSDGEMRRATWRDGFFENVSGFSAERVPSSFTFTDFSGARRPGIPVPLVDGRLRRQRAITADDFAFLAANTRGVAKATLPSPTVNHFFAGDRCLAGSPYRDRRAFFADVAAIYREEIADLAALGCRYLQLDEVSLAIICDPGNLKIVADRGEDPDELIEDYIAVINAAIAERPTEMAVCVHLCRGNGGHGQASGGYEPVAERLFNDLDVDGYLLEYDTERAGGFEPLRFVPKGKMALLGIVSTKLPEMESEDALKRRVEDAARFVDIAQLGICPQCGFASAYNTDRFTFDEEERKLARLVAVADAIWGA